MLKIFYSLKIFLRIVYINIDIKEPLNYIYQYTEYTGHKVFGLYFIKLKVLLI